MIDFNRAQLQKLVIERRLQAKTQTALMNAVAQLAESVHAERVQGNQDVISYTSSGIPVLRAALIPSSKIPLRWFHLACIINSRRERFS